MVHMIPSFHYNSSNDLETESAFVLSRILVYDYVKWIRLIRRIELESASTIVVIDLTWSLGLVSVELGRLPNPLSCRTLLISPILISEVLIDAPWFLMAASVEAYISLIKLEFSSCRFADSHINLLRLSSIDCLRSCIDFFIHFLDSLPRLLSCACMAANPLEVLVLLVLDVPLFHFCEDSTISWMATLASVAVFDGGQYLLRNFVFRSFQVVIEPDGLVLSQRLAAPVKDMRKALSITWSIVYWGCGISPQSQELSQYVRSHLHDPNH
uniref:Uncharacterized protein n=1 Tax=Tanacetum cinerariifolium TaxID=118510 RepID=A0A6L2JLV9_TANCI|nr:hypothetical protein [Tanacetum cinerariifolium]